VTYDALEQTTAEGRPYFLYRFVEGDTIWRFSSRDIDWLAPNGAVAGEAVGQNWQASSIQHGPVRQNGDARRGDLSVSFPISDTFARRYLGPRGQVSTTLTIFRGHEQLPGETVAHWKGRVVSTKISARQITMRCESLFTAIQRQGLRANYQRLCRHALYGPGCNVAIGLKNIAGNATAAAGVLITVAAAAGFDDGYFRGGVLSFGAQRGFVLAHSGSAITLSARMPDLETEISDAGFAAISLAPGCDLTRDTCVGRFNNLVNYGGFPDIPGRNPFGGTSLI
jgi:uncharacterized phage protein (TIGR02218 family)